MMYAIVAFSIFLFLVDVLLLRKFYLSVYRNMYMRCILTDCLSARYNAQISWVEKTGGGY